MNPNMWNIKEILSIPTVNSGAKANNRNGSTSDYSSLTDSQFVFGSQFWPENSQGMSQDISYSSRTSQQSSQETSDSKFLNNYHTKPLLLAGDNRDKSRVVTNVTSGNTMGIIHRFEEDRRKAKEKGESEVLAKELHHFHESLNHIKMSINATENNTMVFKSVLSEGLENFGKTLQKGLSTLQDGIALQFETMLDKVDERVAKTGLNTTEFGFHVRDLQTNLEALRQGQCKEHNTLERVLSLMSTLVSKASTEPVMTDSTVQTSPDLAQKLFYHHQNGQAEYKSADLAMNSKAKSFISEQKLSQKSFKKQPLRGKRRQSAPQRGKCKDRIRDENGQILTNQIKKEDITGSPLKEKKELNKVQGRRSEPFKQQKIESNLNLHTGGCLNPFSSWSQDSDSSVCITGIENHLWEKVPVEPKAGATERTRGIWQLFDINCDSE